MSLVKRISNVTRRFRCKPRSFFHHRCCQWRASQWWRSKLVANRQSDSSAIPGGRNDSVARDMERVREGRTLRHFLHISNCECKLRWIQIIETDRHSFSVNNADL